MEIIQLFLSEWDGPTVSIFVLVAICLGYILKTDRRLNEVPDKPAGSRSDDPEDQASNRSGNE